MTNSLLPMGDWSAQTVADKGHTLIVTWRNQSNRCSTRLFTCIGLKMSTLEAECECWMLNLRPVKKFCNMPVIIIPCDLSRTSYSQKLKSLVLTFPCVVFCHSKSEISSSLDILWHPGIKKVIKSWKNGMKSRSEEIHQMENTKVNNIKNRGKLKSSLMAANWINVLQAGAIGKLDQLPWMNEMNFDSFTAPVSFQIPATRE